MKKPHTQKRNEDGLKGSENLTSNRVAGHNAGPAQSEFASATVVTIQMVRERQLLYNGARLTAPQLVSEATTHTET